LFLKGQDTPAIKMSHGSRAPPTLLGDYVDMYVP
jgi:hypothetical protein